MNLPVHRKVFVTADSALTVLSRSFSDTRRVEKILSCLMHTIPAKVKKGDALPSHFESHPINKGPLCGPFNARFLCFSLVILPFKMVPHMVLKSCLVFLKCKKAGMCLTEKTGVLGGHPSDTSYSPAGCEFSVSKLTIY